MTPTPPIIPPQSELDLRERICDAFHTLELDEGNPTERCAIRDDLATALRLLDENARLRSALERLERNFGLLLAGKPVRDVEETAAEVRAALSPKQNGMMGEPVTKNICVQTTVKETGGRFRSVVRCTRKAGPDGYCWQHRAQRIAIDARCSTPALHPKEQTDATR